MPLESALYGIVVWVVIGAILGALVGPRNGWVPAVGAVIGGTFSLFGVLFLLVVPAPASRGNPEWDRLADELEEYEAAQTGSAAAPVGQYVPCPSCATPVPMRAKRCPSCQADLSACEECGGLIPLDEMTCRYCGAEYFDDALETEAS